MDPDSPPRSHVQLVALVLATVAAKAIFVVAGLPTMWIWGDEMLYFMTSYDLLHLGQAGVPHPNFLNYPPLTSVLVFPVHLLGLEGATAYQASLVILSGVQAAGAVAGYRLAEEVFGLRSALLLALLLVGPPTFASFSLMSEAPFVALYLWLLLFLVRQAKSGALRHAVAVGLLAGLMILTRKNGIGVLLSLGLAPVLEGLLDRARFRRAAVLAVVSLGVALAVSTGWKLLLTHGLEARYGYFGAAGYLERGFLPALASPRAFLAFTRRLLSNYSYVSLSTLGVAIPLLGAFCLDRRARASRGEVWTRVVRLSFHLGVFFLFSGFAAALQMLVNRQMPNTRYLMYGRYLDYFAAPLLVLAFGIVVRHRFGPGARRLAVVLALVLAALVAGAIPWRFFASDSGATSNLGIAWLFALARGSGARATAVGLTVAVGLTLLATRSELTTRRRALAVCLPVLALFLLNLVVVAGWISSRSQAFEAVYGGPSQFVTRHPEPFRDGLYVDAAAYGDKRARRDRLATHKLLTDHLSRVTVGKDVEARLGTMPVMTRRSVEGLPILFENEGFSLRIYGRRSPP